MSQQQQHHHHEPAQPLITLRYSGAPPPPHAAITDITPDAHHEQSEIERKKGLVEKEAARHNHDAEDQKKGFMSKISKGAASVGGKIEKGASDASAAAESKLRSHHRENNLERFKHHFPHLYSPSNNSITRYNIDDAAQKNNFDGLDLFICDYDCKAMHMGQKISGHAIITSQHFLFHSHPANVNLEVLLTNIASIRRSIALDTLDGAPPHIMTIPAQNVVPDTLQIFCTSADGSDSGMLVQLLHLSSSLVTAGRAINPTGFEGTPYNRFLNFLDHAWRAANGGNVPLPTVQYAAETDY